MEHAANRPGYWQIHEVHRVRPLCRAVPQRGYKFVDWQDIAQEAIDKGIVRTSTLFPEA